MAGTEKAVIIHKPLVGKRSTRAEHKCSGPSKGYIEALENRLHEVEQLLLQLLPLVTDEQLTTATDNVLGNPSNSTASFQIAAPPLLNNNTSIDYWEQFPLETCDMVRLWQQSCLLRRDSRQTGQKAPRRMSIPGLENRPSPRGSTTSERSSIQNPDSAPPAMEMYTTSAPREADPEAAWYKAYSSQPVVAKNKPLPNMHYMGQGLETWPNHDPNLYIPSRPESQYTPPPDGLFFSAQDQKQFFW